MSPLRISRVTLLVLLVVSFASTPAFAQTDDDKATAQALFDDGMRLFTAHDFANACPKFAASLKHYPGLGTRGKLAECYENLGRVASAWASWREVAVLAHQQNDTKREQIAGDRIKALEPRLSHLTIVVDSTAVMANLTVTRNGAPVELAALGTAIAVDPGAQHIEASAPGHVPWSTDLTIGEKDTKTVTVPLPGARPPGDESRSPRRRHGRTGREPPRPPHRRDGRGRRRRGEHHRRRRLRHRGQVQLGRRLRDQRRLHEGQWQQHLHPRIPGYKESMTAQSDASLANIFVGVGAAVVVTGVVLWVISPNRGTGSSRRRRCASRRRSARRKSAHRSAARSRLGQLDELVIGTACSMTMQHHR